MTKRLGERIRAEMERLGKNSKAIASAAHDRMVAGLGDDADKHDTVTGKLSKLLNEKPEGVAYFYALDHEHRLEALAHALGVSVQTLREWRTQDDVPTLVLDPRLARDAVQFISSQADDRLARYRVAVVEAPTCSDDGAINTAIRAELARHPKPIAVVATEDASRIFAFAEHSVTTVRSVPRGYQLEAFPELVPIPAPAPPRIFDDSACPLLPLPDPIDSRAPHEPFGRRLDEIKHRVIAPALARGEVPSLSVEDALAWNTRIDGLLQPRARQSGYYGELVAPVEFSRGRSLVLAHLLGEETAPTTVWIEGRLVIAVGPDVTKVAALFAPHHAVTEPEDLPTLRARVVDCHPWQLLEEAKRPDDPLHPLLSELKPWAEARQAERITALIARGQAETSRLVPRAEVSIREQLRELASYGAVADGYAILLALARAVDAPLVAFDNPGGGRGVDLSVLADLGGGHLLRVRTMKLPGRRGPFTPRSSAGRSYNAGLAIHDGGDVLMSAEWLTESNLEGWSPPARRRRSADASYDWDDD